MWRSEAYNLFVQTLNVVNVAILSHKDRVPYRQLLAAYKALFDTQDIVVAIYERNPEDAIDHVTIRLKNDQFVVVSHGKKAGADVDWKVPKEYLKQVNASPQYYVEHPTALNWDWMKARVSVDEPPEKGDDG